MKQGTEVKWIGQLVIEGKSESVLYTGTVKSVKPEGLVVVRVKTPESQAARLVVGVAGDFLECED